MRELSMGQPADTVTRILDAAEVLFAERGFAETSLRTITSTAGVNLAAVNYHFGSKKELIQAVFGRVLTPFCAALDKQLTQLCASREKHSVKDLMDVIFHVALEVLDKDEQQPQRFMRLLGLAYTQHQGHLRRYIVANYGRYYRQFISLLQTAAPNLKPVVFYWRLYFMLGAMIFTLSSFDSINAILSEDFDVDTDISQVTEMLVPAAAALINAES